MADTSKKARLPNFSPADTLILCEIMAEESCVAGLTKHAYLRHRFTSCITSASKKKLWLAVEHAFNLKSEHPRDCLALQKKWDNLVQVHRALYADYLRGQQKTGGGPCPKSISPITDAVIASSQVDNPLSSASTRGQMMHAGGDDEPDEQSRSSFTATNNPDVTESIACNVLSSNYSAVQVVCCQCNCHRQLEILKEEKIRLQIRALKRQLEE